MTNKRVIAFDLDDVLCYRTSEQGKVEKYKTCKPIKEMIAICNQCYDEGYKIIIYTDSMYLINSITNWADKWKENKWKKSDGSVILNKKLIKKLYFYYKNLNIEFHHVKAHKKEPDNKSTEDYKLWYGNNMADKLANCGADL